MGAYLSSVQSHGTPKSNYANLTCVFIAKQSKKRMICIKIQPFSFFFYLWKQKTTILISESINCFIICIKTQKGQPCHSQMVNLSKHVSISNASSSLFTRAWQILHEYFLFLLSILKYRLKLYKIYCCHIFALNIQYKNKCHIQL